jgi:hypothetical protein
VGADKKVENKQEWTSSVHAKPLKRILAKSGKSIDTRVWRWRII